MLNSNFMFLRRHAFTFDFFKNNIFSNAVVPLLHWWFHQKKFMSIEAVLLSYVTLSMGVTKKDILDSTQKWFASPQQVNPGTTATPFKIIKFILLWNFSILNMMQPSFFSLDLFFKWVKKLWVMLSWFVWRKQTVEHTPVRIFLPLWHDRDNLIEAAHKAPRNPSDVSNTRSQS